MATIITRVTGATAKGSPLTNAEVDANFINLNTNKVEHTDGTASININGTVGATTPTTGSFTTLTTSGNVGIGTSSPYANLQVLNTLKVSTVDQSSGSIILGDGGSTSFNVGIGRWNGATNSAGAGGIGYFAQGPANAGGHYWYTGDASAGGTTERLRITSSGNVGIGTTTPSKRLDVNGDASINGLTVGRGAGNISSNTAVGSGALVSNTTGIYNTATGLEALRNNTTGYGNTANGVYALYTNTGGSSNTAIGMNTLYSNTTGTNNTANGYGTLYYNISGISNTANGYAALHLNTTGDYNTANGIQALLYNTTGNSNTANGAFALYSNTTGSQNIASGVNALFYNTTGSGNIANGQGALQSNATGSYNTAFGFNSGYHITTGSKNTILGSYNGNQNGLDIRTANNYIVLSDGDGVPKLVMNASNAMLFGPSSGHTYGLCVSPKSVSAGVTSDCFQVAMTDNYSTLVCEINIAGMGISGASLYFSGKRYIYFVGGVSITAVVLGTDSAIGITIAVVWVSTNTFKVTATNTTGDAAAYNTTIEIYAGGAGDYAAGYISQLIAI